MHWLSQSAETLIASCEPNKSSQHTVDVAVIGSGYGGAVAALRFAEHGLNVAVLERGKEYVAGEFPNDVSQAGKHVRSELATVAGVTTQGYEDGLFDFRIGLRAGALIGNGLGGGSLINAGVGIQPDARVFKQEEWPAALGHEDLKEWYKEARRLHELQTPGNSSSQPLDMTQTKKFQRLKDLATKVGTGQKQLAGDKDVTSEFMAADIAVQLDSPAPQTNGPRNPCNGCGDCVTGCNYNAKLTLTATYLPQAVKAGAEIFTGLTVLQISYQPAKNKDFPWVVHFIRTSERKLRHDISTNKDAANTKNPAAARDQWIYKLRAKRVVVSAGTFGSTEILLRSRAKGLSLSNTALGMGVSGNGDDVAYGYDMKDDANATGTGSTPPIPNNTDATKVVGPTITGIIKFTDKSNVKRSTLTQDGAVPGLIKGAVAELLTTLATVAQIGNFSFRKPDGRDALAIQPKALMHTLTLLGMGHDSAGGAIVYDAKTDRAAWGWPKAAEEITTKLHRSRMRGLVKRLGGLYLQNPAAGVLPQGLGAIQSGPQAGGLVFTVHPLGGCRMADSHITGVVNHWGCAWKADGELHDGLYVMDGSVVPSSLGANPMLTITALAERSCHLILRSIDKIATTPKSLATYPTAPKPFVMRGKSHSSTQLAEVLRGKLKITSPTALGLPANTDGNAALFLEFGIDNWQETLRCRDHIVAVIPHNKGYTKSRLIIDGAANSTLEWEVTSGTVNLFYQRHDDWPTRGGRWCRTFMTYLLANWWPEIKKYFATRKLIKKCDEVQPPEKKISSFRLTGLLGLFSRRFKQAKHFSKMVVDALKLTTHANEVRAFDYKIQLQSKQNPTQTYTLTGQKTIEAAATCGAIRRQIFTRGWPMLERRSVWQQLTELDVQLYEGTDTNLTNTIASGRLVMDLPDMLRRVLPKLGTKGDTLNALIELAGYPMLFLRAIVKTRIFDFKLPDYKIDARGESALPDVDPAVTKKTEGYFELHDIKYPDLEIANKQTINPMVIPLKVQHSWTTSESKAADMIRLGLVRYKHPKLRCNPEYGGAFKAKSIILMNGFDLSTKPFIAEELNANNFEHGGNLATNLLNAGWDVWLFEYRASPLLDSSARYSTMDDIAAFDIPEAIDYIIKTVSAELKTPEDKTQIFAFTHCVGSASMAMSLLAGYLKRPQGAPKLAGVSFSQFHTHVVGSATAQMRLQLAALLSNVLKIETLQFTADTVKADFLYALFDRLFATSRNWQAGNQPDYRHQVYNQCCPGDNDLRNMRPDSTTCKRMTGLLSRLFEHDQLLDETHEKLGDYFGRSNLGVYMQGAKCTEYERLVNADGQNVYVNDSNIRTHMNMPVMLMQGKRNVLFDKESVTRSWDNLQSVRSANPNIALDVLLTLPDYAHFDCTIGRTAAKDVFQPAVAFFNNAFAKATTAAATALPSPAPSYTAKMPRTGPIVGWVRPSANNTTTISVWIEIDDMMTEAPIEVLSYMTHAGTSGAPIIQRWHTQGQAFEPLAFAPINSQLNPNNYSFPLYPRVTYAIANLTVPNQHLDDVSIEMVSIHAPFQNGGVPGVLATPAVNPQQLLATMKAEFDADNKKTHRADPDTLSRKRRTLRGYTDRVIHLSRQQLTTNQTSNLTFVAGGCRHPGLTGFERTRSDASLGQIAQDLATTQPRFMLMLGDQIYADARAGVMDTQSPIEKLLPRYRGAFGASTSFRKLAQKLPMYMVMDDHEINDDWSQEQQLASRTSEVLTSNARTAFGIYQYSHSPGFPADVRKSPNGQAVRVTGFNYCYEQSGFPFLVLDTRTNRTRVPVRQILDASQWLWLEQWLLSEQAKGKHPKFIASGSVMVPGLREDTGSPSPRSADSWLMSPTERTRLLSFIADNNIENVVFLSSDYHCSAATTITFTHSKVKAWAIVAPPLHAPMRFANVQAGEVCDKEVISLSRGRAQVTAQTFDGEGWLSCQVTQRKKGSFALELAFNLRQLDSQDWGAEPTKVKWRL